MRADGVLRLILNVALFPGMSCERQDKWVRFSAFEDAQLSHLAVRAGSVKSAEELVSPPLFDHRCPGRLGRAADPLTPLPPPALRPTVRQDPGADAVRRVGCGLQVAQVAARRRPSARRLVQADAAAAGPLQVDRGHVQGRRRAGSQGGGRHRRAAASAASGIAAPGLPSRPTLPPHRPSSPPVSLTAHLHRPAHLTRRPCGTPFPSRNATPRSLPPPPVAPLPAQVLNPPCRRRHVSPSHTHNDTGCTMHPAVVCPSSRSPPASSSCSPARSPGPGSLTSLRG